MTNKKHIISGIFWGCIAAIVVGNLVTNHKAANISSNHHEPESSKDSVSYSEAVAAIMKSDMLSAYKQQIISFLGTNMSEDIYKSIICIAADSRMLGANKRDTIQKICEQYREKNMSYNERM